jgi:PEP-CTERM motif
MKLLAAAFLALVSLTTITPYLHADNIGLTLKTGVVTDAYVETPILNGEQFTYVHETLGVLTDGNLLNSSTSVFTATYVDVLGTLGVFNFTDVCTTVTIIGPSIPCQDFAFSFTDVTLGDASIIADVAASINLNVGLANVNVGGLNLVPDGLEHLAGVSVGLGSGQIDFTNPPPAVPEPGTLSLMATGLLGAAGAIRRKFGKA